MLILPGLWSSACASSGSGSGSSNDGGSSGSGDGGSTGADQGAEDAKAPTTADAAADAATLRPDSATVDSGPPVLRGHIAYTVVPPSAGPQYPIVIYVAPLDGSRPPFAVTSLTDFAETPKFSRDGATLYYSHAGAGGAAEVRQVGLDGTNDHVVYPLCPAYSFCYALGEDSAGRIFVWFNTAQAGSSGELYTLVAAPDGGSSRVRWPGDPGCSSDAALSTPGTAIVITTACSPASLFLGDPAAAAPLVGHPIAGVSVPAGAEHVQTAGGRIYMRATGADAGASAPVHAYSFAADGSDPRDLNLGDDLGDFVVSDDASFVLASHTTGLAEGGTAKTHSIVAHAGAVRMPIPGVDALLSNDVVVLAWTPY
jgi:hypothetical protein